MTRQGVRFKTNLTVLRSNNNIVDTAIIITYRTDLDYNTRSMKLYANQTACIMIYNTCINNTITSGIPLPDPGGTNVI